ncbi:hypothetical protein AAC387_Pa08g1816 [Persea americana]
MAIATPKEDHNAKFEENGHSQTTKSKTSGTSVAPYKNHDANIATACSTPVLEEFEKFDFDGLQAQKSLEPPSSYMQSLPSVLHDSLLKEETLMVVTLSPLDKKYVVQIAKDRLLVFAQYVEENFVWDLNGFHITHPVG